MTASNIQELVGLILAGTGAANDLNILILVFILISGFFLCMMNVFNWMKECIHFLSFGFDLEMDQETCENNP